MARPITTTGVGRVNRRFLFLALVLAVISAVMVYALVTRSDTGGGSGGGDTSVVVAAQDITAGTEITEGMLDVANFADTQVPAGALSETSMAVGLIAKENIAAREAVLSSSVVDTSQPVDENVLAYIIAAQERGMAITAVQVVGAGGLVLPGDHVDVYWMPAKPTEDVPGAILVASDVEVLAVQQAVLDIAPTAPGVTEGEEAAAGAPGDRTRNALEEPVPEAITITLMLSPREASNVFCAEDGGSLRLAVRAFGDASASPIPVGECIKVGEGDGLS